MHTPLVRTMHLNSISSEQQMWPRSLCADTAYSMNIVFDVTHWKPYPVYMRQLHTCLLARTSYKLICLFALCLYLLHLPLLQAAADAPVPQYSGDFIRRRLLVFVGIVLG